MEIEFRGVGALVKNGDSEGVVAMLDKAARTNDGMLDRTMIYSFMATAVAEGFDLGYSSLNSDLLFVSNNQSMKTITDALVKSTAKSKLLNLVGNEGLNTLRRNT